MAIGVMTDFQWSPDGKHYAFAGYGGGKGYSVIVDGKEQPKMLGITKESLRWSSDSKHLAYGAQVTVNSFQTILDGVAKPGHLGDFFALNRSNPPITFAPISFSPDGNHLAYVAQRMDGTGKAVVYVDATAHEGPTASHTFPSWSPDSRHFATVITTGKGWVVMVDGKLSPSYEDVLPTNVAAARFVDSRTFRFYGVKAGQIYRVRLELSP